MKRVFNSAIFPSMLFLLVVFMSPAGAYADSSQVKLDVELAYPLLLEGKGQSNYMKVGLTGFKFSKTCERPSVNTAIVIDKSGSMSGEKIRHAKQAAIMAVKRLSSVDIVSVVVYDSRVRVLVPATKSCDKDWIIHKIRCIEADGSTALYGGVEAGAREVEKFLCENRVNRIILLSDGIANVGPDSPEDLGRLGKRLIRKGISVTTIGLGIAYNEDLMTKLAYKSDGNHYFAKRPCELAGIFDREFGQVLSVVAQEIKIDIECADGIRLVKLLGRQGTIDGQKVSVFINQLYSESEKFVMLEIEVPKGYDGQSCSVAKVDISYGNMKTHTTDKLSSEIEVKFTDSAAKVEQRTNSSVMSDVVELIAVARNELALELRDKGDVSRARVLLGDNVSYLRKNAHLYKSKRLSGYAEENYQSIDRLDSKDWDKERKTMREQQYKRNVQQER